MSTCNVDFEIYILSKFNCVLSLKSNTLKRKTLRVLELEMHQLNFAISIIKWVESAWLMHWNGTLTRESRQHHLQTQILDLSVLYRRRSEMKISKEIKEKSQPRKFKHRTDALHLSCSSTLTSAERLSYLYRKTIWKAIRLLTIAPPHTLNQH